MEHRHSRLVRWAMYAGAAVFVAVLVLLLLQGWRLGLFRDVETLQRYIDGKGAWAPVVFLLLQVLQILVAFLPGGILLTGGVVSFGPWLGLFYNMLGTVLGSAMNFWLARKWGQPLAHSLMQESTREKYSHWLNDGKRFEHLFAIAILLPFFPDDALCLIAGLSNMGWHKFLMILLLKLPSVAVYSIVYYGAGSLLG